MCNKPFLWLVLIIALFTMNPIPAQSDSHQRLMKNYDVKHYNLDLQVSNTSPAISGNVTILSSVVAAKLDTFVIELINTTSAVNYTYMNVDSVKINQTIHGYTHKNDLIIVPLAQPVNQGELFTVQVFYHGLATAFDFQKLYDGTILSNTGIVVVTNQKQSFSMSESRGAKIWWPCKQDLADKADSVTFSITTDSSNVSGSNGILKSTQYLPNHKVKYTWVTNYPTDYYLISFAVAPFKEITSYAPLQTPDDSVKIISLLNPSSPNYKKNIKGIEVTKKLLKIYSDLLGDYPFKKEKYGYCSVDTLVDGMENQTMTTINSDVFDTIPADFMSYPSWVAAHELAHSWFGDEVTCKTWNDIWINEGFASYMEYVVLQLMHLDTLAKEWLYAAHSLALLTNASVYVPDSVVNDDSRVFSYYSTYKKGACILHILRYEINNDSLFFKGLKEYLNTYKFSVASASDFKNSMEQTTGMDLTQFFDQWYYGQGYPTFNIKWWQNADTLRILSDQTTPRPATPLFKTHFDVRLNSLSGDTIVRLYQDANYQVFQIPVNRTITSVEFDPDDWLLKRVPSLINGTSEIIANTHSLHAFPNPFHESANLEFHLNKHQIVKIEIFDINGTIMETSSFMGCEGKNLYKTGSSLSRGIYLCHLITSDASETISLIKI